MFEPKPIHRDAVPAALERARTYRLLNQPRQAESICLDVLQVDPDNQGALVMLLLALTDEFAGAYQVDVRHAEEVLERIQGEYERTYYAGVIAERWGKTMLHRGTPIEGVVGWFQKAMARFEAADKLSTPENDEAVLRWNACARLMNRLETRKGAAQGQDEDALFVDEIPPA